MDSKTEEEVKEKILAKIAEIEAGILVLKEQTKPQGLDLVVGRISKIDDINNRSINKAQLQKYEAKLKG